MTENFLKDRIDGTNLQIEAIYDTVLSTTNTVRVTGVNSRNFRIRDYGAGFDANFQFFSVTSGGAMTNRGKL